MRAPEVQQALAEVARGVEGGQGPVAFILPDGVARTMLLEAPAGVAPREFARYRITPGLPYAPEEALVDVLPVEGGRVLAAAVRRSVVEGYEAAAAAAGLDIERLDLSPLAALSALARGRAAPPRPSTSSSAITPCPWPRGTVVSCASSAAACATPERASRLARARGGPYGRPGRQRRPASDPRRGAGGDRSHARLGGRGTRDGAGLARRRLAARRGGRAGLARGRARVSAMRTAVRDFSSRPRRRPPQPVDVGLLGIGVFTLILASYATGTSWAEFKRARQHVADVRRETEAGQARLRTLEARSAPTAALANQALLSSDAAPPRLLSDLAALLPPDVKLDSLALAYGDGIGMQMQVSAKGGRCLRGVPAEPGGLAPVRGGDSGRRGAGRRPSTASIQRPLPRRGAVIARWIAAGLLVAAVVLYAAVAVPTQRQAAAAADEYRRARDDARDVRSRLARLERRDAVHTRAAAAVAGATPGETVRVVRRSVVQTLQDAGVSGVRLSVTPGRPPFAARVRLSASGPFPEVHGPDGADRAAGNGGRARARAAFAARHGVALDLDGVTLGPGHEGARPPPDRGGGPRPDVPAADGAARTRPTVRPSAHASHAPPATRASPRPRRPRCATCSSTSDGDQPPGARAAVAAAGPGRRHPRARAVAVAARAAGRAPPPRGADEGGAGRRGGHDRPRGRRVRRRLHGRVDRRG